MDCEEGIENLFSNHGKKEGRGLKALDRCGTVAVLGHYLKIQSIHTKKREKVCLSKYHLVLIHPATLNLTWFKRASHPATAFITFSISSAHYYQCCMYLVGQPSSGRCNISLLVGPSCPRGSENEYIVQKQKSQYSYQLEREIPTLQSSTKPQVFDFLC